MMCFSGARGWKLCCRSAGCALPAEQLPKTGERRSRRKEQRKPRLPGSTLNETETQCGLSVLSSSSYVSSGWGRMKWSIQDSDVAHKRGVPTSLCTFADHEAAGLPGYRFIVIPLCNFSLQQSWDISSVPQSSSSVKAESTVPALQDGSTFLC